MVEGVGRKKKRKKEGKYRAKLHIRENTNIILFSKILINSEKSSKIGNITLRNMVKSDSRNSTLFAN